MREDECTVFVVIKSCLKLRRKSHLLMEVPAQLGPPRTLRAFIVYPFVVLPLRLSHRVLL